jgi:serine protease Do
MGRRSRILAGRIQVVTPDGTRLDASLAASDAESDVALLACDPGLPPPLPLAGWDAAREGDEVAITGYPVVGKLLSVGFVPAPSTSRGSISARRLRDVDGASLRQLQTDAAIAPGNSGGPLYSLRTGAVLGLTASRLQDEQGIGFATPADALLPLLHGN